MGAGWGLRRRSFWFLVDKSEVGVRMKKNPDENGGTKINPERRLPTAPLGVEMNHIIVK